MLGVDGVEMDLDLKGSQMLLAAAQHDLDSLRILLRTVSPNFQDADTGHTALHTAIAVCAESETEDGEIHAKDDAVELGGESNPSTLQAEQTLKLLFQNGAIWNDLDNHNETPGCLAWRLGLKNLYEIIVEAGVRSELLLNRLDEYEPLLDATEKDEGSHEPEIQPDEREETTTDAQSGLHDGDAETETVNDISSDNSTLNEAYLRSSLSFSDTRLLDSSANAVMMDWETDIMLRTADLLLSRPGLRILNLGHGMGIFDKIVQKHMPGSHHIVEAHPAVLSRMRESGWIRSSDAETNSKPKYNNVTVHEGRWQEVLPRLKASNQQFDAIFFDTFAESYSAFREFFSEQVISLLDLRGAWSFFHGLGADRQACYDVYTKVVEIDLFDAGYDVEWERVETPDFGPDARGHEELGNEWEGIRRRYWNCESYRLPVCRFVG